MSVYIPKAKDGTPKSRVYAYDFVLKIGGRSKRFTGSTGQTTRRAAEEVERRQRELAGTGQLGTQMTVLEACDRYWSEVSQHADSEHARAQAKHVLSELIIYYGESTTLVEVTPDMVAKAMSARAATPVMHRGPNGTRKPGNRLPTAATCNRQIVEPMRRILRRAKQFWGVPIDLEQFRWGGKDGIKRQEPKGRVRSMAAEEESRFWAHLPPAFHGIAELYLISGKRQSIWLGLKKFQVDLTGRTVRIPVLKQGAAAEEQLELTDREHEIIAEAYAASPSEWVFTAPFRGGGALKPITKTVLYKTLATTFEAAGIANFRPHDFRHTFASRAIAAGANLKALQATMNHADIRSTSRYAHLTDAAAATKAVRASVTVNRQAPPNVVAFKKAGG